VRGRESKQGEGVAGLRAAAGDALGVFKSWYAQSFSEADGKVCSIWSQPEKSEGKYSRRGEVFVFVTHAPARGSFDRVSFEIGYTFKSSTPVTVTIGKQRFALSAGGSAAWSASASDDRRLVSAMRGGRSMVLEGVSSRGTQTRDTFSLFGFSAAHKVIGKACPR
jgi:hypothetical protein